MPVGADSSCPPPQRSLRSAFQSFGPRQTQRHVRIIFIKIHDVYPDDRAELLTEGILRVRYRKSFSQPVLMLLPIIERN